MPESRFALAATRACEVLLGKRVVGVEHPGGRSRRSVRVRLADSAVIATFRKRLPRAKLEAGVLRDLGDQGAPVPRLLASRGNWIIQEDLGPRRLSEALDEALAGDDLPEWESLLGAALESLHRVHRAGAAAGLDQRVAPVERKPSWLPGLLAVPRHIGAQIDLSPPALPEAALSDLLRLRAPRFLKWDARPGNAVVRGDGSVAWFDWEHAACRNRLDDLAWLLGDEYVADWPDAEARMVDAHIENFSDDLDAGTARRYLAGFGVFHTCVRLSLIASRKAKGEWWDWAYCLKGDKIGVTPECARRLCRRGARWSVESGLLEPLAPWFEAVERRLLEDA